MRTLQRNEQALAEKNPCGSCRCQPPRYGPLRDIIHEHDESHSRSALDYLFALAQGRAPDPKSDRPTAEVIPWNFLFCRLRSFEELVEDDVGEGFLCPAGFSAKLAGVLCRPFGKSMLAASVIEVARMQNRSIAGPDHDHIRDRSKTHRRIDALGHAEMLAQHPDQ